MQQCIQHGIMMRSRPKVICFYLLPAACCLLLVACCLLVACLLPACCLLVACCLLPAACCVLPAACCADHQKHLTLLPAVWVNQNSDSRIYINHLQQVGGAHPPCQPPITKAVPAIPDQQCQLSALPSNQKHVRHGVPCYSCWSTAWGALLG